MLIYDSEYRYNGELPALPKGERIRIEYQEHRDAYFISYWQCDLPLFDWLARDYDMQAMTKRIAELKITGISTFIRLANAIEFAIHYLED